MHFFLDLAGIKCYVEAGSDMKMSTIIVRLDYATVNFAPGSMSSSKVSKVLLGGDSLFWKQKGISENSPLYSPLGLRWLENNGYAELPHKLEISGVGCSHFAMVLPDLVNEAEHRFSRLDFAFDVLVSRAAWRSFICAAFEASLNSERERKNFRLSGQGEAMTIYIGSRRSAKFFRIYNKTLEDPKYQFVQDGQVVDVPDDMCVIRYEVELKRHKVTAQNDIRVYDPSPAFEWYYGDEEAQARLCEEIRKLWLSFGDSVLLPEGFETAEIGCLITKQKFCSKTSAERLDEVRENLHDYPRSFEHTLNFLVSRYGKYVPYIVADTEYISICHDACKAAFGFVPEYYLEPSKPSGFYDLDDSPVALNDPVECPWSFEQLELSQIDFLESEV